MNSENNINTSNSELFKGGRIDFKPTSSPQMRKKRHILRSSSRSMSQLPPLQFSSLKPRVVTTLSLTSASPTAVLSSSTSSSCLTSPFKVSYDSRFNQSCDAMNCDDDDDDVDDVSIANTNCDDAMGDVSNYVRPFDVPSTKIFKQKNFNLFGNKEEDENGNAFDDEKSVMSGMDNLTISEGYKNTPFNFYDIPSNRSPFCKKVASYSDCEEPNVYTPKARLSFDDADDDDSDTDVDDNTANPTSSSSSSSSINTDLDIDFFSPRLPSSFSRTFPSLPRSRSTSRSSSSSNGMDVEDSVAVPVNNIKGTNTVFPQKVRRVKTMSVTIGHAFSQSPTSLPSLSGFRAPPPLLMSSSSSSSSASAGATESPPKSPLPATPKFDLLRDDIVLEDPDNKLHFIPHKISEKGMLTSVDTVADLIKNFGTKYSTKYDNFVIFDCRYKYEFDGGHIAGAINVNVPDIVGQVENILFGDRCHFTRNTLIIIHCEFSSLRGPKILSLIRALDRKYHPVGRFEKPYYSNIYLMSGGYEKFYEKYAKTSPEFFAPFNSYTKMFSNVSELELCDKQYSAEEKVINEIIKKYL